MLVVAIPAGSRIFPTLSLENFTWMPEPIPRLLLWCSCPFLPTALRLSPKRKRVSAMQFPLSSFRGGAYFEAAVFVSILLASKFARHPDCSDRAVSSRPPWLLHPGTPCIVTSTRSGYANHLNRTIGDKGLSPY